MGITAYAETTEYGMPLTDTVGLDMDILNGTTEDLSYAGNRGCCLSQ